MTKKKLLNETTIRRWGKLANIGPLTENFLEEEETLAEEEGEEELEMDAEEGGDDMEAADDAGGEASPEMEAQVEDIVSAVVDALAQETGVDIEMEAGGDDDADEGDDEEAMMRDPMMRDKEPMMRDKEAMMRDKDDEEAAMRDPMMREESLDIEVIDDEQLTEAVLKRVVERLLKRK